MCHIPICPPPALKSFPFGDSGAAQAEEKGNEKQRRVASAAFTQHQGQRRIQHHGQLLSAERGKETQQDVRQGKRGEISAAGTQQRSHYRGTRAAGGAQRRNVAPPSPCALTERGQLVGWGW
ncbi:hypothetical protein FQA47_016401 [Oryzias melastigma]|uniref:Uncharacterized protein n=1 Tax=Oryzias melastigma TaxID=30732 RepID=A0A834FPM8_ORYME|nr:hypothetical protein FQA47_016401 [Oryzias melastigma]